MTKDEALKMALEALQKIYIAPEHEEYIRVWWPACEQAITAIKEALAQPEQQAEPVCPSCKGAVLYKCVFCSSSNYPPAAQPEQVDCPRCGHVCSQRPWVGLTEEDLDYLCHLAYTGDEEFALAVQAWLKERNT